MRPITAIPIGASAVLLAMLLPALLLGQVPTTAPTSRPATQASPEKIRALIEQLGDKNFKLRAAAENQLIVIGAPALEAMRKATESTDAEIKSRAAALVIEIDAAISAAASDEMAKNYLWSYPIKDGCVGAPAVFGDTAYAIGKDGKFHAVDIKTGKKVWAADPGDGIWGAEVFAGNEVVFLTQGMAANVFSAKDGKPLWKKDMNKSRVGEDYMAGRLNAWDLGELVVTQAGVNTYKAFKAATGDDAWQVEVKQPDVNSPCAPAFSDGVLYAKAGQKLVAIELATRKEVWSQDKDVGGCTALGIGGKTVCCLVGDRIVALDTAKGQKLWAAATPAAGDMPPGMRPGIGRVERLVVDDSRLYLALFGGQGVATYDLKKGDRKILKLDMEVPLRASEQPKPTSFDPDDSPVLPGVQGLTWWIVSAGRLYAANDSALMAFDAADGHRIWLLRIREPLSGEPVIQDGVMYFATERRPSDRQPITKLQPQDSAGLHALKLPK